MAGRKRDRIGKRTVAEVAGGAAFGVALVVGGVGLLSALGAGVLAGGAAALASKALDTILDDEDEAEQDSGQE